LQSIAEQTSGGVPYVVEIQGVTSGPAEVQKLLREVSQAIQKKDDPPQSLALLKRRAEGDLPAMKKVLRSFGFFRGTVHLTIVPAESVKPATTGFEANLLSNPEGDPSPEPPSMKPVTIRFKVDLGPRFTFSKTSIGLVPNTPAGVLSPPPTLGDRTGCRCTLCRTSGG